MCGNDVDAVKSLGPMEPLWAADASASSRGTSEPPLGGQPGKEASSRVGMDSLCQGLGVTMGMAMGKGGLSVWLALQDLRGGGSEGSPAWPTV